MDPEPEALAEQPAEIPAEGPSPWIPLGPAHLLVWVALLWPLLASSVLLPLLMEVKVGREGLSWVMSLPYWLMGGAALALGLKAQESEAPGTLRRAAFFAAAGLWLFLMGIGLVFRLHIFQSPEFFTIYRHTEPWVALMLALVPMGLMLGSKEEQSGGSFDASIAVLAILGGLGFVGPVAMAFGALVGGHPMLVMIWESLRRPADALKSEWVDGGDEARRLLDLGLLSLLFLLAVPLILALLLIEPSYSRFDLSPSATWAHAAEAYITAPIAALAALLLARRSGYRQGRGLAITTLVLAGLLLLPLLALFVFLLLWDAHVIR